MVLTAMRHRDEHLKESATEPQKMQHAHARHEMNITEAALRMAATAGSHGAKMAQTNNVKDNSNV